MEDIELSKTCPVCFIEMDDEAFWKDMWGYDYLCDDCVYFLGHIND